MLGLVLQRRGELDRASNVLRQAVRRLKSVGTPKDLRQATVALIETLMQLGQFDEAEQWLAGLQNGVEREEVVVYGIRALVHSYRARWDEAIADYDTAYTLAADRGFRMIEVIFANNLADTLRVQGQLERAGPIYERAIHLAHVRGMAHEPFLRLNLAQLDLDRGNPAAAWEMLTLARAGLERLGRQSILGAAHAVTLRCAAELGEWQVWEHHFERAYTLLEQTGLKDAEVAEALERASELAAAADKPVLAKQAADLAVSIRASLA
jgi:lipopolysaccharide biosynthesis regulator YciM